MNSALYRPLPRHKLEKYLAVWRDFGERLDKIVTSNPGRWMTTETKMKIENLKNLTLEAMAEVRREA